MEMGSIVDRGRMDGEDTPPMSTTLGMGGEWGDEGKGKGIHFLGHPNYCDIAAKLLGGNNAGNAVEVNGETYKCSLLSTACLWPGIECVIGRGMQVNPSALLDAIVRNEKASGDPIIPRLFI